MNTVYIPEGYRPCLNSYDTQLAIGMTKRLFADVLAGELNLRRVSAPLFVEASTGLNDDLNGVERPVSFSIKATGTWPSGSVRPSSAMISTWATACTPT